MTFSGHTEEIHGVPVLLGQFSSLGFPRAYSASGDVFTYDLRNADPNGHVRLTFEDWNLSPYSDVMVNIAECSVLCILIIIIIIIIQRLYSTMESRDTEVLGDARLWHVKQILY